MNKILVLGGATASGKTALAIEWAGQFDGEIINADSRQLYRFMDIGTAKPTSSERAAAPHHLLDVVTPDQTFTLAQYQAAAMAAIAEIQSRGKLPILTGGTGLYITATLEGWQTPEVPPNPILRAELEALSNAQLLAKLQVLDPVAAASIDSENPRRLVRAVEVCLETGRPFSELRTKHPPPFDALYFALTMPREELYQRADHRIEKMLAAGWLAEVENLLASGYAPALPAMSALGYPQMCAVLRGELTIEAAKIEIQGATHKFIRRQYTWLRGHDPDWQWISPQDEARSKIAAWLQTHR